VEKREKDFIIVRNKFMDDIDSYSYREQFIYCMLLGLSNDLTKSTIISIDMLTSLLGLSMHTKNRTAVKDTLCSMEEKGLISLYEDILNTKPINAIDMKVTNPYSVVVNEVQVNDLEKRFTMIHMRDMLKFMKMEEKYKELSFAIYFNIIKRIYTNEYSVKYSYPCIKTIEEDTGINQKTIIKHIKILKDNEILYYETVRIGKYRDKNYYSRWEDMEHVIEAVKMAEQGMEF
jgi:DNA-binding transcriptional regulator YhcF (GntR family)